MLHGLIIYPLPNISKPPTQTEKSKTLQKMVLAYFHNVIHLLSQLTDKEVLLLVVTESAKILPYVVSSRKSVKLYLKVGSVILISPLANLRLHLRNV